MTTKEEILQCLRESEGFVSGEELSRRLGVSRTAIWKNINTLRSEEYEIESVTNRGYRLLSCPELFSLEGIRTGLKSSPLTREIYFFPQTDSTNEEAKRGAVSGAAGGSLFVAEQQTGGKGRLGRAWVSPSRGGLWFSLLLRQGLIPVQVTSAALLAGLAVARAVCHVTGLNARIKWPNDVVVGSRKVCGILTETMLEENRVEALVIGIGVNVNIPSFPEELAAKATSLSLESGKRWDRTVLLQAILEELELLLQKAALTGESFYREEYRSLCISLQKKVTFWREGEEKHGTAVDITPQGELLVRTDSGEKIAVYSGEVSVQGIYEG